MSQDSSNLPENGTPRVPVLAGLSRRKFLRFAAGSTALAALSTGLLA